MPIMSEMIGKVVGGAFDGKINDHDAAIAAYQAHNAAVKRNIPADRLLTYDVAEGWEPLCRFLGVPAPATDFPRVNTRDDFGRMVERMAHAH